jgi:hypothetical protein
VKTLAKLAVCVALLGLSGCILLLLDEDALYEETFSGQNTAWTLGSTATHDTWIDGGAYHIETKAAVTAVGYNQVEGPFGNAQADVDIQHVRGVDAKCAGGLVLRAQDGLNFLAFLVSPAGTFSIRKWVGGTSTQILGYTSSPAVVQGVATNHLTAVCSGSSFRFFVNGTEVAMVTDTSFATGRIGVIVIAYDAASPTHMAFDNLVVQDVP